MRAVQSTRSVSDLRRLTAPQSRQKKTLKPVEERGSLAAKKGRGTWDEQGTNPGGSGSGVASPFVELDYSTREFWAERTFPSVDGIISFRHRPVRATNQVDANEEPVQNQWAMPPL